MVFCIGTCRLYFYAQSFKHSELRILTRISLLRLNSCLLSMRIVLYKKKSILFEFIYCNSNTTTEYLNSKKLRLNCV